MKFVSWSCFINNKVRVGRDTWNRHIFLLGYELEVQKRQMNNYVIMTPFQNLCIFTLFSTPIHQLFPWQLMLEFILFKYLRCDEAVSAVCFISFLKGDVIGISGSFSSLFVEDTVASDTSAELPPFIDWMTAPSSPFKTCSTVFLVTSRTISVLNSNFNCNKINYRGEYCWYCL